MEPYNNAIDGNTVRSVLCHDYLVSLALTANGSGTVVLNLEADSYFEVHELLGKSSRDTNTNFVNDNFSCRMVDQSTGRQTSNARINQALGWGNALQARKLMRPVLFPPRGNILFDVLDLFGNTNTVTLILRGFKLFI